MRRVRAADARTAHPVAACDATGAQLIEPLLDLAHHKTGQLQRNAAICLARLAKNAHCLAKIREQHGMQILMQYVKA